MKGKHTMEEYEAVSYTHLDVYKRQDPGSSAGNTDEAWNSYHTGIP